MTLRELVEMFDDETIEVKDGGVFVGRCKLFAVTEASSGADVREQLLEMTRDRVQMLKDDAKVDPNREVTLCY